MEDNASASRKWKIYISILALIILALLFWLFIQRSQLLKLVDAREVEKVELQKELDSLMSEHNTIKEIYGTLSDSLASKDSIIQANAIEIRKLLDTQYEYYKIRKKMAMLQKVAQGYVQQMDSLYTVNRELKEENERIREVVRTEQGRNQNLIKDKEELTQKMNQAAVLQAYGVTTTAFKVRGNNSIETDKANRTDKLKICFTIGENSLIEQGTKVLYVRISRPDNVVVTKSKYDVFVFNGQEIPYSIREDINYQGKAMRVCVDWIKRDTDAPAMKGRYQVGLFFNDREIGQGSFELR
ncbi:MAG: hypothetical protein JXA23_02905 [Bacteroidales bacterium]|nr:hypothetical protein [Bacteroidales bacterium]